MIALTVVGAAANRIGSKDLPGWYVAAWSRCAAPLCQGRKCCLSGLASDGVSVPGFYNITTLLKDGQDAGCRSKKQRGSAGVDSPSTRGAPEQA